MAQNNPKRKRRLCNMSKYGLVVCVAKEPGLYGLYENVDNIDELFGVKLKDIGGFNCIVLKDPSPVCLRKAILELSQKLQENTNSIGFFYYAGHEKVLLEDLIFEKDVLSHLAKVNNIGTIIMIECCTPNSISTLSQTYKNKLYFICSSAPGVNSFVTPSFGGILSTAFIHVLSSPFAFGKNIAKILQEITERMKKAKQLPYFVPCDRLENFCFVAEQPQICIECEEDVVLHENIIVNCIEEDCRRNLCKTHNFLHCVEHYAKKANLLNNNQ